MPQAMICFPVGGSGGVPDNSLPGGVPGGGNRPDNSLPTLPAYPSNGLPGGGVIDLPGRPVNLPALPPVFPNNDLPDTVFPGFPAHPIAPGGPELPPGVVWPPLPPIMGGKKYLVVVAIPGIGMRWTVIDTSLSIGGGPVYPPEAAPK